MRGTLLMTDSFFTSKDNHWFVPTDHCRGPWDVNHCHAGPPTGLAARAAEELFPNQRLTRLTVNLMRPLPHSGFFVTASVLREGRMVSTSRMELTGEDGKICARAEGLHMTRQDATDYPTTRADYGRVSDAQPGGFPISKTLHDKPAFNGDGVETRYPAGHGPEPGPTVAWMRTVPLLDNETPSAFQRICPLADCGNAFGRNAEPWEVNFMNPDLTIALFRDPVGEWLGSDSRGFWEPDGIGLADATLFDNSGVVGRALQTLLLRKP